MKYIFQNYEIDFLYENSYNNITLNIENIDTHTCYIKEFTIDTFNKLQFEKHSNINSVKSGIHFFEKVFNQQNGYTLFISENTHLLSNFKKINILTIQFKGVLEEYFEIYCNFDIEEKVFSMEEKVIRMMEKMKGSYENKINNIENQLNNLQNMILNIVNVIGMPITDKVIETQSINKVPSSTHINKVPSSTHINKVPSSTHLNKVPSSVHINKVPSVSKIVLEESEPFIGLNYEEIDTNKTEINKEEPSIVKKKENIIKNISIQKNKKNIKELAENQTEFYDTFYFSEDDEKKIIKNITHESGEIIPKKIFITYYYNLVVKSTIPNVMNKWYNFVNNSDEHIILNIERSYLNLFMTNHGKIFIFHTYGGLVNDISLQHYAEISGFENSTSIKDKIIHIETLFKNMIDEHSNCESSKVDLLNFFKKIDVFIENII